MTAKIDIDDFIHTKYESALGYGDIYNRHLPEKDKIILGDKLHVEEAIRTLISNLKICDLQDQQEVVDLIFELNSCRQEITLKKSGSHKDHLEVIRTFNIAADVIKGIMDSDYEIGESKDVQSLYQYIRNCVPGAEVIDEYKNYHPRSKYSTIIFQLVNKIRHVNSKLTSKKIYGNLDTALNAIYVSGLRPSRTASALEEAYQAGKNLHGGGALTKGSSGEVS